MLRPLKIAHTSDVHLDDGAEGARAQVAFVSVIDHVLRAQAQLFLIAGDLFDHNRVSAPVIDFVYDQLSRIDCPVVIIPGNHDCMNERSILRRSDFANAGDHVHLLSAADGAQLTFDDLHATVWGRGMIEHEPDNKPLHGVAARRGDRWHIGMAHGFYVDYHEPMRSSLITPAEIAASGLDYLALGHVHVAAQMRHGDTLACYPGSPLPPYSGSRHVPSVAIIDLHPGRDAAVRLQPLHIRE